MEFLVTEAMLTNMALFPRLWLPLVLYYLQLSILRPYTHPKNRSLIQNLTLIQSS